jgi:predicted Fe-Mo cluster-binding NifX family protein
MIVCVAITSEGLVDPRWGRADRVAIAQVAADGIEAWQEFDVGWNSLHDSGTEGSHHARVARFLRDHHVEVVVAGHMGSGMRHMLGQMGVTAHVGVMGNARDVLVSLAHDEPG